MEKALTELIEMQKQFEAMLKSCADFNKNLEEKRREFMVNHLGFPKDAQQFNMYEVIEKTMKAKQ